MTDQIRKLLNAAEQAASAAADMMQAAQDSEISAYSNVGAGETSTILADGLRLLIEATDGNGDPDADTNQLHGALIRFLEERT